MTVFRGFSCWPPLGPVASMSFLPCALLWARLSEGCQAGYQAAISSALRAHVVPFPWALGCVPAVASPSSSSSTSASGESKARNTSLFLLLTAKPQGPSADGDIGAELTYPLDKNEIKVLDKLYKRKEIQKLAAHLGLDASLFHQTFFSFKNYTMQPHSPDVDIHIISNICFSAAHVEDLYPFFLETCKAVISCTGM